MRACVFLLSKTCLVPLFFVCLGLSVSGQQRSDAAAEIKGIEVSPPDSLKKQDIAFVPILDTLVQTTGVREETVVVKTDTASRAERDSLGLKIKETEKKDSLLEVEHALRIGFDLASPLMPLINGQKKDFGWMVLTDFRVTPKLYAAVDFGMAKRTLDLSAEKVDVDGWFARAGVNYSILRGIFSWDDMMFAGARLCYSQYSRRIYDASVKSNYWSGEYPVEIKDTPSDMWLDLSVGVTVKLFRNFYLSLQGGYDVMVAHSDPNGIGPLVVPGIGQVYNKSTAFSLSYSLAYRIPLYKKVHKVRVKQKRETVEERNRREAEERAKKEFKPAFTPSGLLEE